MRTFTLLFSSFCILLAYDACCNCKKYITVSQSYLTLYSLTQLTKIRGRKTKGNLKLSLPLFPYFSPSSFARISLALGPQESISVAYILALNFSLCLVGVSFKAVLLFFSLTSFLSFLCALRFAVCRSSALKYGPSSGNRRRL